MNFLTFLMYFVAVDVLVELVVLAVLYANKERVLSNLRYFARTLLKDELNSLRSRISDLESDELDDDMYDDEDSDEEPNYYDEETEVLPDEEPKPSMKQAINEVFGIK